MRSVPTGSDRIKMSSAKNIQVSVVCYAYNQAKFISKALDSILAQKTTFEFEVIVHDDASTDNTSSILMEYAKQYNRIVPIIEQCNLYQHGGQINEVIAKYIRGKYVAYCECDDWFIDENKLQLQYDYMIAHPDCSLCVHAVEMRSEDTKTPVGYLAPSHVEKDYSTDEIIRGGGGLFGTNSMFFPSKYFLLPELFRGWGVGDYPECIYLSMNGSVHYLPFIGSVYRVCSEGSWTQRMGNPSFALKSNRQIIEALKHFNSKTGSMYVESVNEMVMHYRFENAVLSRNIKEILFGECRNTFYELPVSQKMRAIVRCCTPLCFRRLLKEIKIVNGLLTRIKAPE